MSGSNLFLELHTVFSEGRSGGLVFPSLREFSTDCCDPHSQWVYFNIADEAEVDVFREFFCFSMTQWMLFILSLVPMAFLSTV